MTMRLQYMNWTMPSGLATHLELLRGNTARGASICQPEANLACHCARLKNPRKQSTLPV